MNSNSNSNSKSNSNSNSNKLILEKNDKHSNNIPPATSNNDLSNSNKSTNNNISNTSNTSNTSNANISLNKTTKSNKSTQTIQTESNCNKIMLNNTIPKTASSLNQTTNVQTQNAKRKNKDQSSQTLTINSQKSSLKNKGQQLNPEKSKLIKKNKTNIVILQKNHSKPTSKLVKATSSDLTQKSNKLVTLNQNSNKSSNHSSNQNPIQSSKQNSNQPLKKKPTNILTNNIRIKITADLYDNFLHEYYQLKKKNKTSNLYRFLTSKKHLSHTLIQKLLEEKIKTRGDIITLKEILSPLKTAKILKGGKLLEYAIGQEDESSDYDIKTFDKIQETVYKSFVKLYSQDIRYIKRRNNYIEMVKITAKNNHKVFKIDITNFREGHNTIDVTQLLKNNVKPAEINDEIIEKTCMKDKKTVDITICAGYYNIDSEKIIDIEPILDILKGKIQSISNFQFSLIEDPSRIFRILKKIHKYPNIFTLSKSQKDMIKIRAAMSFSYYSILAQSSLINKTNPITFNKLTQILVDLFKAGRCINIINDLSKLNLYTNIFPGITIDGTINGKKISTYSKNAIFNKIISERNKIIKDTQMKIFQFLSKNEKYRLDNIKYVILTFFLAEYLARVTTNFLARSIMTFNSYITRNKSNAYTELYNFLYFDVPYDLNSFKNPLIRINYHMPEITDAIKLYNEIIAKQFNQQTHTNHFNQLNIYPRTHNITMLQNYNSGAVQTANSKTHATNEIVNKRIINHQQYNLTSVNENQQTGAFSKNILATTTPTTFNKKNRQKSSLSANRMLYRTTASKISKPNKQILRKQKKHANSASQNGNSTAQNIIEKHFKSAVRQFKTHYSLFNHNQNNHKKNNRQNNNRENNNRQNNNRRNLH